MCSSDLATEFVRVGGRRGATGAGNAGDGMKARKFQLLPKGGKQPPPPAPEPRGGASSPPKDEPSGTNETNGTNGTGSQQPLGPEAAVQDHLLQDKAQYFPQDPTAQPFPPYSTDPKVTASVQVPLKVEVERRKRLFFEPRYHATAGRRGSHKRYAQRRFLRR